MKGIFWCSVIAAVGLSLSSHDTQALDVEHVLAVKGEVQDAQTVGTTTGSLHGEFKVSAAGKATYSIDLPVPPGINGQTPHLELHYSSTQSDSSLGIGWSIAGASRITRCTPNWTIDGVLAPITYASSDRFCLDGQRLIMVKGSPYGADGTEYRTAIESWQRIVAHDSDGKPCGSGPCSFTVTDKFGHTSVYGSVTGNGRILAAGKKDVRVWSISSRTDLNGNKILYSYTQDPLNKGTSDGAYYLSKIDYTSNSGANVATNRKVEFKYEKRDDLIVKYLGGAAITQGARLSKIQTVLIMPGSSQTIVQEYRLHYEPNSPSRLKNVEACESNLASATCLPATAFQWTPAATSYSEAVALADNFGLSNDWTLSRPRLLGDVNGDGLSDIIGFGGIAENGQTEYRSWVALSQGTTFASPVSWSKTFAGDDWVTSRHPRSLADVNGDGRMDVIGFNAEGVIVGLSDGSKFNIKVPFPHFKSDTWLPADNPRVVTDVTGDGCADIVGFKSGVYVAVAKCEGSFTIPVKWAHDDAFTDGWPRENPRSVADINGDGMSDLIGFADSGVKIYLSTGTAFTRPSWNSNVFQHFGTDQGWSSDSLRSLADVNGDGLADIVGIHHGTSGVEVAINTGAGFLDPVAWSHDFSTDQPIEIVDINGDQLADIVQFSSSGVVVGLSNGGAGLQDTGGSGFDQTSSFSLAKFGTDQGWTGNTPRQLTDVNGDGLVDIVGFAPNSVHVAVVDAQTFPRLINQITDGYGGAVKIDYAPMSDSTVYQDTESSSQLTNGLGNSSVSTVSPYPISGVRVSSGTPQTLRGGVRHLVSAYTLLDGPMTVATTNEYKKTMSYTDAKIDVGGRGWQGFRTRTHTDLSSGTITLTTFHQSFPKTGLKESVATQCTMSSALDPKCTATGSNLHVINYSHHKTVTKTGTGATTPKVYAVPLKSEREDHYDYGTYKFSIGSEYDYDTWGNLSLRSYLGYVTRSGTDQSPTDNLYTLQEFYPPGTDPDNWQLAYLKHKKLSTSNSRINIGVYEPADISLSRLTYHTDGTMNLKSKEDWDDTNTVFLSYFYEYDSFGNKTKITDPAGNSTTLTYETAYNTYKDTKTSPPNSAGVPLITHYGYDPRFGKLAATTGPNGNSHILCHDGFGRLSELQVPLPAEPAGVSASTNCVTSLLTGSTAVATAPAVTSETREHKMGSAGMHCKISSALISWTTGTNSPVFQTSTDCFDGMGRHREKSVPMNGGADTSVVHMTYNSFNRMTTKEMPHFASVTSPVLSTMTYDAYGRLTLQKIPSGAQGTRIVQKKIEYSVTSDGLESTITEADGSANPYVKTLRHKIINNKTRLDEMVVAQDNNAITKYEHDLLGRRKSLTDPIGVINSVKRDSLGRVASIDNPSTGEITFSYHPNGVLNSKTDNLGTTTYTHDALGRMVSKIFFDGSSASFIYDSAAAANGLGRMTGTKVLDSSGNTVSSKQWTFDSIGNKASETLSISKSILDGDATQDKVFTSLFIHAPTGNLWQLTYPDASVLTRMPNTSGEISTLTIGDTIYATYEDYDTFGHAGKITLGNGLVERRSFWPVGSQGSFEVVDSSGTDLYHEIYDWDDLGLMSSITDEVKHDGVDLSQSFDYTSMRLTSARSAGTYGSKGYQFDNGGNLQVLNPESTSEQTTYSYHSNSNTHSAQQIKTGTNSANETVFSAYYDTVGNIKSYTRSNETLTFDYDPQSRMTSATRTKMNEFGSAKTTTFGYDARASRLWKHGPDGTLTIYVNNHYKHVILPDGETQTVKYVGSGRKPIAAVSVSDPHETSKTRYYHQDYRRSTVATSNDVTSTNKLETRITYDPFGTVFSSTGPDGFERKFAGLELDEETDLYDHGARYFNSDIGRFISPDSGLSAKWTRQDASNRYAYGLNAATSITDIRGRMSRSLSDFGGSDESGDEETLGYTVSSEGNVDLEADDLEVDDLGVFLPLVPPPPPPPSPLPLPLTEENVAFYNEGDQVVEDVESDGSLDDSGAGSSSSYRSRLSMHGSRPDDSDPEDTECNCFTKDTLVSVPDGKKAIVTVDAGNTVWAYDRQAAKLVRQKVIRQTVRGRATDRLLRISVAGSVIEVTPEHPFWDKQKSQWVPAKVLKPGNMLQTRSGDGVEVTSVEELTGRFEVYNFEVDQFHNYYVSEAEVLVHNLSCSGENTGLGESSELGAGDTSASSEAAAEVEMDTFTSAAEATADAAAADTSAAAAAGTTAGVATGAGTTAALAAGETIAAPAEAAAAMAVAEELLEVLPFLLAF